MRPGEQSCTRTTGRSDIEISALVSSILVDRFFLTISGSLREYSQSLRVNRKPCPPGNVSQKIPDQGTSIRCAPSTQ